MTIKRSRQREAIRDYLCSTREHPSAEAIYDALRPEYPRLSLGTVYRNLELMCRRGEILKLEGLNGVSHYDAVTAPHYHLICGCCGSITDLPALAYDELLAHAARACGGRIDRASACFYGICRNCLGKQEDKEDGP